MNDVDIKNIISRLGLLEERLQIVEAENVTLKSSNDLSIAGRVDAALRELGERMKDGKPNPSYFNVRFRNFEAALQDIRSLGYIIGRRQADETVLGRHIDAPPDTQLKSKLCTQADMDSDWALFWTQEMKLRFAYHRKVWEFVYIAQALWTKGKMKAGMSGLGFGCGNEPLPSLFAKFGVAILGTDLGTEDPLALRWGNSNQHAAEVAALRQKHICADENLLKNITFQSADMNNIDKTLDSRFDFCWSACALEHLGSVEKGFTFIRNSLKTLKPGGVAVHTTEYTFDLEIAHDHWPTVLYKRERLLEFVDFLTRDGYAVAELDLAPGNLLLDGFADLQTKEFFSQRMAANLHLKTVFDGYACTSVGLIIQKPQAA
jgi:2-polyprenyl-3-methyl-5-hydroxy-6-metoxy-1,4-benzoquinol methylase